MEAQSELERLIEEQERDCSDTIRPEFYEQVPLTEGIANCIGMEMDGEIVSRLPRPPRGTLLVGSAPWHGTRGGYENHKCRCDKCRDANATRSRQVRQRRRKEAA